MRIEDATTRKYQHIRDELAEAIRTGHFPPKQKLPSETQLAKKFVASRGTVLRALLDLSHAGLIERRRGSGTFVKINPPRSGGKFGLIAPALPDLPEVRTGSVLGIILRKIAEETGRRGYSVMHHALSDSPSRKEEIWQAVQRIIEQRTGGAFFLPFPVASPETQMLNLEIARALAKAGIPIVLLDCDLMDRPERSNFDVVSADNQQGGALLAEHLVKQGCRRIGFVSNVRDASTVSERILGYRSVLTKHDIAASPKWLLYEPELKEATLKKMMEQYSLDGLIFKDDHLAALGCRYLASMGYRVGQEVKVAGFDDAPIATLLGVPLTTVRQPLNDVAVNAINLLLDRIQNPSQPGRTLMVNCELVVRESTKGPPRSKA